jgi:hypothetical protein
MSNQLLIAASEHSKRTFRFCAQTRKAAASLPFRVMTSPNHPDVRPNDGGAVPIVTATARTKDETLVRRSHHDFGAI